MRSCFGTKGISLPQIPASVAGRALSDAVADAIPASSEQRERLHGITLVRVIHHSSFAFHTRGIEEPPESRVQAFIAVVTEEEEAVFRYDDRAPVVAGRAILGLIDVAREKVLLPLHPRMLTIPLRRKVANVRLDLRFPVDKERTAFHLKRITGKADEALDDV